jgi:hypothetical protein
MNLGRRIRRRILKFRFRSKIFGASFTDANVREL